VPRENQILLSPFPSKQSERLYRALNPSGDPFRYEPKQDRELEVIGLLLWAAEGDKSQLSLANGNPSIIRKYLEFLRTICHLDEKKIKAVIHCHDTLPYDRCLHFWSVLTKIPINRFNKPFIKRDRGGTRNYPYGIVRIVATNIKLVHLFKVRLAELGLPQL
jgi:hypothetical protein